MRVDGRARQHHRVVIVGMLDTVGEHDAAPHAVAEHHQLQAGVLGGGDPHQGVEVAGVLGHVAQIDPLAAGAAVPAVIQCVGDQAGFAEPGRDVVVAAGVFGVAVGQHHHPARRPTRASIRRTRSGHRRCRRSCVRCGSRPCQRDYRAGSRPAVHTARYPFVQTLDLSVPLRKLLWVTVTALDEGGAARRLSRRRAALPAGTARPLLPDDRLTPRCGGPGPGNLSACLEVLQRFPGQIVGTHLAVPHRHQHLPDRTRQPQAQAVAERSGRTRRPTRPAS